MKISVAMTTYNGASYLREQLDSILAQQRLPDELIVCDDQSTDDTPQILSDYCARVSFPMKVLTNDQRLGSTRNFEQAIRFCTGDLIALCDQDDVWYQHKLATIEHRFDEDESLGLVFSNGDLIDGQGKHIPGDMWKAFRFTRRMQKSLRGSRGPDLLLSWPFVTGATEAFRAEFRDVLLPIPADAPTFVHDRWIAVVIGAVARISFIGERLIAYRLHSNQQIGTGTPLLKRLITPFQCSSDQIALAALRVRLKSCTSVKPAFLEALQRRETHLRARSQLSTNPVMRLKDVAFECLSGRYHHYPMPSAYALRDVLVGTR